MNRSATPWVFVSTHFPLYDTTYTPPPRDDPRSASWKPRGRGGLGADGAPVATKAQALLDLEPLMLEFKTDVYFAGHNHNYETTWPMAHNRCVQRNYSKPRAPIHITSGAASLLNDRFVNGAAWTREPRLSNASYSRLTMDRHKVHWQQVANSDGAILDAFVITKTDDSSAASTSRVQCTRGRVIAHSDRATAATQCTGAIGDACTFLCDAGFWPVGEHVCQTTFVGSKVLINATFFGGRCDRLCGGAAAATCPTGQVPVRSNTTDTTGGPCLKTVCMSADDALKHVGRGAYEVYQLARFAKTGVLRDHVELGAAVQPDMPGWIAGTGVQLIFECVGVEMGWTTKQAAQARVIQTLQALNGQLPGFNIGRNPHGIFPVFCNVSTGAYRGAPGAHTYTPMDSAFMMGGVLFAKSYFDDTDPGTNDSNTIAALADELFNSTRFDSLLCNRQGQVDPTATGIPMLQGENASFCSATQFPQPDGLYEFDEEIYAVYKAYVQACVIGGGGNGGGDGKPQGGCANKAIETMWTTWQGRKHKPNHIFDGHPLMSLWSGYMLQFPYFTIAPFNSDPTYVELYKQSWLADWAYFNSTDQRLGARGRYGLGAGPSPQWCSGGAAYIADRIGQKGTLPTGMSQCRIYSPYITAGYLPAAPEVITRHLLELLADGEAVFSVPGTPHHILWRRALLDPGWNNNNNNDTGVAPVEVTMVDLSSLLFGLSTLWLEDGFYQKYTNHGWWPSGDVVQSSDDKKHALKTDDAVASSPEDTWISNDVGLWNDTDGNPLHAHAGGMYFENGQYYFVGAGKMAYDQPYFEAYLIGLYRSADLGDWTLLSPSILNKSAFINATFKSPLINPHGPVVLSRPKLIKSAATGRYILVMGLMSSGRGTCVASSDTIDGDYTLESCFMANKKLPTCDSTVFRDESGEFFLAADTGSHAYEGISKLSTSGLSVTSADCNTVRCNGSSSCAMFSNETTAGEAPALFRSPASGKAYLWTSHLSGWAPNAAMLYEGTTETLCGATQDFKLLGNPSLSPTTHNSQSTFLQPVVHADNSTTLLYMSDRWCNPGLNWGPGGGTCAPNGNGATQHMSGCHCIRLRRRRVGGRFRT